jgi:hypothetical protein
VQSLRIAHRPLFGALCASDALIERADGHQPGDGSTIIGVPKKSKTFGHAAGKIIGCLPNAEHNGPLNRFEVEGSKGVHNPHTEFRCRR